MDSPSPRRYQHHSLNSPKSSTSSTSSNGGGLNLNQKNHLPPPLPTTPTSSSLAAQAPPPPPPPLYAPRNSLGRSESGSPYPTTFVQADTNSFKQVVQMLTGCNETSSLAVASSNIAARGEAHSSSSSKNHHNIPPMKTIPNKKNQHQQHQPGFKLYERRNNNLNLNPLLPTLSSSRSSSNINNVNVVVGSPRFSSPRNHHHHHHHHHEVLSPSILDLPALVLSPVTPLIPDPFGRSSSAATPTTPAAAAGGPPILDREAEERAIKEKGFYLHPSPGNTTPRDAEPRLLPLFPTASPRASASAAAAASSSSA